jgi:hypothetical protein
MPGWMLPADVDVMWLAVAFTLLTVLLHLLHAALSCRYGHLVMLGKGSRLPQDKQLYIVQSGIVKVRSVACRSIGSSSPKPCFRCVGCVTCSWLAGRGLQALAGHM